MIHTPTIIDRNQFDQQHIAIRIRCCGDPKSDQWHSYVVAEAVDNATLQAWADLKKSECAAQHDTMLSAVSALNSLT